jgi:hypothetical protein
MDGCLPLDEISFPGGVKWFFDNAKDILAVNSGRAGIYAAVLDYGAKSVYLPFYLCGTVKDFLEKHGINVKEYNINSEFMPSEAIHLESDEMIIWVNYFGCMLGNTLEKICLHSEYGNQLIVDNTHAYFCPQMGSAYSVYSCRKFVGVPDGGFVIHKEIGNNHIFDNLDENQSSCGWDAPLQAYYTGANSGYESYLKNTERMSMQFEKMPLLTKNILYSVDYEVIALKRRYNFEVLHSLLGKYNQLNNVDFHSQTAYYYPFMRECVGLRDFLHEKNIFTSCWWKRVIVEEKTTDFEKYLGRWLFPLPIDQRYNKEDMFYLANLIVTYLKENGYDK